MAVLPNAVTFKSTYSPESNLVDFMVASVAAFSATFPSLPVLTNLSARSGARISDYLSFVTEVTDFRARQRLSVFRLFAGLQKMRRSRV